MCTSRTMHISDSKFVSFPYETKCCNIFKTSVLLNVSSEAWYDKLIIWFSVQHSFEKTVIQYFLNNHNINSLTMQTTTIHHNGNLFWYIIFGCFTIVSNKNQWDTHLCWCCRLHVKRSSNKTQRASIYWLH